MLEPLELIRRWLLHVLPKGLVRVRHYGWLSPAAHRAFARIRFMLGLRPLQNPRVIPPPSLCPRCQYPLELVRRILPVRGPPLCRSTPAP